jgi:hypothetical protein
MAKAVDSDVNIANHLGGSPIARKRQETLVASPDPL